MVDSRPLLIRADASPEIGTGHVMRCLALAQAWRERCGRTVFLTASPSPALRARLETEGMEVRVLTATPGGTDDAQATVDTAAQTGAEWAVVDGYRFAAEYQRLLKEAAVRVLFVDDYGHAGHYSADLILNQSIDANENLYSCHEPYTKLLLGTRYALLRGEFLRWRGWHRRHQTVARKVLVTLGGGDPDNVTLKVLEALQQSGLLELEVRVAVGLANPHRETLQSFARRSTLDVHILPAASEMAELMAWADVAISAAGSTCWELAFMGLPCLLVVLAANQLSIAKALAARGVVVSLGWHHGLNSRLLGQAMGGLLHSRSGRGDAARAGQWMVDGLGCTRVIEAMAP